MKPLLVISGPVDTFSGYGARSRDIALAIIKSENYDVKILSQRWGNTPFGFLQDNNKDHVLIKNCILPQMQLPKQPDCWIQITVPNEFQSIGRFNIGITAGIETTICAPQWIDGINRMDLTLVSSEHSKKVFESSNFDEKNQQGQQIRQIKLEKPIEVLFEGINTNIYQKIDDIIDSEVGDILNDIPEDFNFLYVGHWLQGDLGEDRKDTGMLIKTFLETFKNKKQRPGLILKTSIMNSSVLDREEILNKIRNIEEMVGGDLPSIYLLHGELSDEEVNELYNHPKVKAHVSFTKGEGFGRPLLESSTSQKPVLASEWSGHLDFLHPEMSVLLPGELKQIHRSAVVQDMLIPESGWFTVNYNKASEILDDVYKNYKKYVDGAKRQAYLSRTEFNLEKMSERLINILEEKISKPVQLKLPQLKKIELPKLKKVE